MLENIKTMLGIALDDTDSDGKIKIIISNATARLKLLLGGIEPPEELEHIIFEVALARFNRIGSEGLESHTVEGESQHFLDDDFAAYENEIQAYLETLEDNSRGKVRFL